MSLIYNSSRKKQLKWPAQVYNKPIETFDNLKLGAFICWGAPTYTNDSFNILRDNPPPNKSVYTYPSNMDELAVQWIDDILNANSLIDYFIFTASHVIGYPNWNSKFELNNGVKQQITDPILGEIELPYYLGYKYTGVDFMGSMIKRIKQYGRKIYLYYCTAWQLNNRGSDHLQGDDQIYKQFVLNRLRELAVDYKPDGLWLDTLIRFPDFPNISYLYNGIKEVANNCYLMMNWYYRVDAEGNVTPEGSDKYDIYYPGDLAIFPIDCYNMEGGREFSNESYWGNIKTKQGIDYYILTKKVGTGYAQQHWYGDNLDLTTYSGSLMEQNWNSCKARGIPLGVDVQPNKLGLIPTNIRQYLQNFTL